MSEPSFFVSQLAIAERNNFPRLVEATFQLNCKMFNDLFTSTPRIKSATNLILRGEIPELFKCAIAIDFLFSLSCSALKRFLAPMTALNLNVSYLFYYHHAHGNYG